MGALLLAATVTFMTDTKASPTAIDPASITCSLAMPAALAPGQPAPLTLTLVNGSGKTLYLLKRNTPLEGWFADSMTVTHDGLTVPYAGAMAKRPPPTAREYVRLLPGKPLVHRLALDSGYDVSATGNYRLRWRGELMDLRDRPAQAGTSTLAPVQLSCGEIAFTRQP